MALGDETETDKRPGGYAKQDFHLETTYFLRCFYLSPEQVGLRHWGPNQDGCHHGAHRRFGV